MSIQDDIEALEKALALGVMPGPWANEECESEDCWCRLVVSLPTEGDDRWVVGAGSLAKNEASYIAACSPDRIRRLLNQLKYTEATRDAFRDIVKADAELKAMREKYADAIKELGRDFLDGREFHELMMDYRGQPYPRDAQEAYEAVQAFIRKHRDAQLSKAMDLLWDAAEYVEIEAEHGGAKAKDLVAAIDRFRDEVMP